jgi:glucose-6-phosphate-specific signal transduction histidine kinase
MDRLQKRTTLPLAVHSDDIMPGCAPAREVEVRLGEQGEVLVLEVHEKGRGIARAKLSRSEYLGNSGIKERTLLLGGDFSISSSPDGGTAVKALIPQPPRPKGGNSR